MPSAGLDVTIREGGPDVNVPQLLAGGAADFGIGSNSFIPLNLVQQNVPLRAVMAIFQKDPQVLISHPRRDLNSLADMRGKPILISAATMTSFWPWLQAPNSAFSDSQIRKYTFNLAPFLVDPNAIQEGYLTSEPLHDRADRRISRPRFSCSPTTAIPATPTWCWCRRNGSTPIRKAVQAFLRRQPRRLA